MYAVIDGYVNAHAERRISSHQGIVYRKLDEEENYYQVIISIDFLSLYIYKKILKWRAQSMHNSIT